MLFLRLGNFMECIIESKHILNYIIISIFKVQLTVSLVMFSQS